MNKLKELDTSHLISHIFYPSRDATMPPEGCTTIAVNIDDEEPATIVCRFYEGDKKWPTIIHFHGNGEIAADYDDIYPFYKERHINLLTTDYRGYGMSSGHPSISGLYADAWDVYCDLEEVLTGMGYTGPLFVMGRSLGSQAALEIMSHKPEKLAGLILESSFSFISRLIKRFGLHADRNLLNDLEAGREALISRIHYPALIIHGEIDDLVPISEGRRIFDRLPGPDKTFLEIEDAGHNDIMFRDRQVYYGAIEYFVHSRA